jgi:alkylation response protein AidB-like acyl-CoA dehydrogenase
MTERYFMGPVIRSDDISMGATGGRAEKLIDQMKEMGIFGLAIPKPWGACRPSATPP